ncbi:hypothetical protein H8K47_00755 [Undibacterium sp. CY7W]|uniref:Uncharacterized protein n=1 Tax=Undibacterium rugosum TaxID=2762291 RepID=A0A923KYT9_9BURK|nr:hypothetical protein [Undibacterium rugosum]MBC3933876.1 hypothetical protein [Undibacterium rugosum]
MSHILAAILEYVRIRPNACDTTEGIHNWWIDWKGEIESTILTQRALEHLEANGDMQRVTLGGRTLWRLNKGDSEH